MAIWTTQERKRRAQISSLRILYGKEPNLLLAMGFQRVDKPQKQHICWGPNGSRGVDGARRRAVQRGGAVRRKANEQTKRTN